MQRSLGWIGIFPLAAKNTEWQSRIKDTSLAGLVFMYACLRADLFLHGYTWDIASSFSRLSPPDVGNMRYGYV
jgi:hypothetical protein